ncbi:MBL fold metallo-hydrolase [Nisaea acidiphila]|uniref:MBL fold metallo-hydrolase n=1 Tax=Nisaea acidiphila TaxID=1862145 RepID=A0A9J7AQ17_9PROT|nr:MBL fold metallo-hydrolase [Nisaea acidiphila]UUX49319.1 MBL fold metallo-hydrolase [Nisaea acidiphila]
MEAMSGQVPALYRRRIGEVLVTAICDGFVEAPFAALTGIEEAEAEAILKAEFRPTPPRISVNCFLLQSGDRTALVDTGAGDTMGPKLGKLASLLASLDLAPGDVDTVLLTHMHPDHSNGLTSPGGERLFPAAEIVVEEKDVDHWFDDGARSRVDESKQTRYFDEARRQIAPYQDRRKSPGKDSFPGVSAVPLHGHTPGHTGYLVESDGEALLIWGDIFHVPDIQVRHPGVAMAMDSDQQAAIAARRRALDMAAADRLLVAGMHHHFPGFAHIVGAGDGYRLIPESWAFEA